MLKGELGPVSARPTRSPARMFAAMTLAVVTMSLVFLSITSPSASAATPTILNTGNWLETLSSVGETNNSGNRVWLSLAVKHDVGRKVTGIKIDDDWNTSDNTTSKSVKTVTAQQPTIEGGFDHSRINFNYAFPTADTGMSCGAFGVGGTSKTTKQIRVRAILDNGDETATSTKDIVFTRADCSGGEDFPYLYQRSQTATSINTGQSVTFTFRGDDSDSTGNADFAGINWRMRRVSDGATTTPVTKCYSSPFDNTDKTLDVTFPRRGRWVVEAELLNSSGCGTNNNSGSWAWIGAVDVNTAAADSPTATLTASRPQIGGNSTITATFADGSDSAEGGRIQTAEWDLDGNASNGVGGFEVADLGSWNANLSSPRSKTVNTAGMAPGLKTVRVRVGDNGALAGADTIRRTRIATTTYLVDTPPVATDLDARTVTGRPRQIALAGTDVDGDALSYEMVQAPASGTVTLGADGVATYTSASGFAGIDTFTFRASDGYGGTSVGEVTVRVDPGLGVTGSPSGTIGSRGAEIEFGSAVNGASFECSFDGAAWAGCVSPRAFTDLADGQHDLRIRVTAAGLTNPDIETASWTVDARPEILLTAAPAAITATPDATVEFVASETGATAPQATSCRLDGGSWRPCESPHTYTDLDDGDHRIEVRATDAFGKASVTAHDWTISATPPSTEFTEPPPATLSNSSSFVIGFAASDPGDTFECRLDGGDWDPCVSPATHDQLADGPHVFRVRAVNDLGVPDPFPAVFSWTIDTDAPQASVLGGPPSKTSDRRPVFELGADEAGSSFECSIDSTELGACSTPVTPTGDLSEGSHVLRVVAIDRAGNRSPVASRSFEVDLSAPPVSLTGGAEEGSSLNAVQSAFTFGSSEAGASFSCRIDQGDWVACASPRTVAGLGDGTHRFEVRAADAVGNVSAPAVRNWTVDTIAPETRIVGGPSGVMRANRATFNLSSDEPGSRFHCSLDGAAFIPCMPRAEFGDLGDGDHELRARATDVAGNQDPDLASREWTVDTSPLDPPDKPSEPQPEPEPVCTFDADLPDCGTPFISGSIAGAKNPALGFEIDSGGAGLGSAELVFGAGAKAIRTKSKLGQGVGSVTSVGGPLGTLALKLPKKRGPRMVLAQRSGATVTLTGKRLAISGLPAGTGGLKLKLKAGKGLRLAFKRCGTSTWRANLTDAAGNRATVGTGVDRVCVKSRKGARR